MSHEVEIKEDGTASMFSAEGKVPWHGLGTVIEDEGVRSAEALKLAGLDWNVELAPMAQEIGEDEDTGEIIYDEVPGIYSVRRDTDFRSVGQVGGRYTPLQNVDAFQFGDDILDSSGAHWTTAGALKNGSVVWMLAKLPETVSLTGYEDEDIQPYILVSNSHDGSTAVSASVTPVRVVCNNTLTLALKGTKRSYKARHTKNMSGRINEAKRALGVVHGYMGEIQKVGVSLLNEKMTAQEFANFLEALVPSEGKEKAALTKAEKRQNDIAALYQNKPDLQNIKGTKWGALQAVIDFNDHHINSRGSGNKAENRMRRILDQPNITHDAFKLLIG